MEANNLKIAVLSGKGGTGKTLISVNLAAVAEKSVYIDCDVEEPNGYLFFKPEDVCEEEIKIKIPAVDDKLCSGCRKCVDFCKFNALAFIKNMPFVFDEVCHSCGGCILFCPQKALFEKEKAIGKMQKGISEKVTVNTGILNTGEASGIPIIKKLLGKSCIEKISPSLLTALPAAPALLWKASRTRIIAYLWPNRHCLAFITLIWFLNWSGYSKNHSA